MKDSVIKREPGSYKDPSGFVFYHNGMVYRHINQCYKTDYDLLEQGGLLKALWQRHWLVKHAEVEGMTDATVDHYKILQCERIPFISYPYEWSFSQLQKAALLTLRIQELSLQHGMSLKDASAYNIQFFGSQPVFIDSLSFQIYQDGDPWMGYRQFCMHFLAPLLLSSTTDMRMVTLLRHYMEGIPLDLCSRLLPLWIKIRPTVFFHIVMHARYQQQGPGKKAASQSAKIPKQRLMVMLNGLAGFIRTLKPRKVRTLWQDYYAQTNYQQASLSEKERLVDEFLGDCRDQQVWDLGANDGRFSQIVESRGGYCVAMDMDINCLERHFQKLYQDKNRCIHPLYCELGNPSGSQGWHHRERKSLVDRGPADKVLALAVVHHLAIGMNIPLEDIASFLADCGELLIIEFVPKEDSQVEKMLASREDIFPRYSLAGFEGAFKKSFQILEKLPIKGSRRHIYKMRKRNT